ncbi:dephospho-CoA kinase [Pantoea sp. SoEX]|uniref:dephospho-CoA kinase n=1 Tax=Pantoea sp. SoEX TaxID=2576763 RepID=UPI00135835EF|nr:dephospho-CoA kinase [Pantoea sp. SoEX]MXP51154.1 dephospho-CoA kinase [Pantoea sp. SoEX]
MPYVVALTGGIGSGKSTIANIFAKFNITIIDSDVIAYEIVKPGSFALKEIIKRYGCSMLTEHGSLSRSSLRERIFQYNEERYWLNNLLHPIINIKTQELKKTAKSPYILWVVPLLIEQRIQYQANRILVVNVRESVQLKRTQTRDNVKLTQVEKIIAIQATPNQRMAFADDIINNTGTIQNTFLQVIKLHKFYIKLAKIKRG